MRSKIIASCFAALLLQSKSALAADFMDLGGFGTSVMEQVDNFVDTIQDQNAKTNPIFKTKLYRIGAGLLTFAEEFLHVLRWQAQKAGSYLIYGNNKYQTTNTQHQDTVYQTTQDQILGMLNVEDEKQKCCATACGMDNAPWGYKSASVDANDICRCQVEYMGNMQLTVKKKDGSPAEAKAYYNDCIITQIYGDSADDILNNPRPAPKRKPRPVFDDGTKECHCPDQATCDILSSPLAIGINGGFQYTCKISLFGTTIFQADKVGDYINKIFG